MAIEKSNRGGARPGSGRKKLAPGSETVPVVVRMTAQLKEKLQRLGGASWVRDRIEKAKEPAD